MSAWSLIKDNLKWYPHFDPPISAKDAEALATSPNGVASHSFYPFLLFTQRWNRFAPKGEVGSPKKRPIRYAARRDAYIYSRYRHVLSQPYEAELQRLGLTESILAYRRIIDAESGKGKCNIHFARDAVLKIRELGDCCVLTLDISGFFESLDHDILKRLWCRMLNVPRLPEDHFRVFDAITRYAVVDKQEAYERLGYFGVKSHTKWGAPIKGYLVPYKEVPKRLCKGSEFREKIAGHAQAPTIIKKNRKGVGIPQGAPISDLLANLYLLDFDAKVLSWVRELNGAYYRYSDDIMIIVKGDEATGRSMMERVAKEIRLHGKKLKIKGTKSSLFVFTKEGNRQRCRLVSGSQGRNGLEYLGFRYNGDRVYIRDSTLSNLRRKVARAARAEAGAAVRRYPTKSLEYVRENFDYERLIGRFGRVKDFGEKHDDYREWTFWTYVTRASKAFGELGAAIPRQLRRHRALVRIRADKELAAAIARRDER